MADKHLALTPEALTMLTAAGQELLSEGRRLLAEMAGVANRVRRVATGWETELTIAVDGVMSSPTVLELVEAFFQQGHPVGSGRRKSQGAPADSPPTRLRLRSEVLAGTWEAPLAGQADLAIGIALSSMNAPAGFAVETLGELPFVLCMSPNHPLAQGPKPLGDDALVRHRAVAVSDSASRLLPLTVNLLPGQDVLTVSSQHDKLQALLRGLEQLSRPATRRALLYRL